MKNGGKVLDKDARLEAFEKMLSAIQKEYADIISRMDRLKSEGKVKSVTYMQLMSRKFMYIDFLGLYDIYGLIDKKV